MTNTRSSGMANVGSIFAELEKRTGAMGIDLEEIRRRAEAEGVLPEGTTVSVDPHPMRYPPIPGPIPSPPPPPDPPAVDVPVLAAEIGRVIERWSKDTRAHAAACALRGDEAVDCDCGLAEIRTEEAMSILERGAR